MAKKGYWVVCYKSVSNPAAVSEYMKLAATALEKLGGRVIVGSKPAKTHEAGSEQRLWSSSSKTWKRRSRRMKAIYTSRLSKSWTMLRKETFASSKADDRDSISPFDRRDAVSQTS